MDKSVESKFTSDFWRDINDQYFMIKSKVSLQPIQAFLLKFRKHASMANPLIINKVLKNISRSRFSQINFRNLKLRLSLLLLEREHQSDPIQNLIYEMIDFACFDQLIAGLQEAQNCIHNVVKKTDEQQLSSYQLEQEILQNLQHQIDWSDDLSRAIAEKEDQLKYLTQLNQQELCSLETHLDEINATLMYKYSVEITGEFQLKLTKTHIQLHEQELQNLRQLIISQQNCLVAEGIGKATFNERSNTITVVFDKYIHQTPVDVSLEHFENLQLLRETPYEMTDQFLRSDDVFEMQMCHFCRQMTDIKNLKQCNYNHYEMGLHEYNEEILTQQRYKLSSKGTLQFFQDLYSSNYIIENQQIQCKRYFCYKCLKYEYDNYDINIFTWICPLCSGQCTCIRCYRNDMIYKLKRTYLELSGDLEDIYNQSYFEILVNDKRKLIQHIPIEFNRPKSENEETLTPKSIPMHRRSIHKNIRKKGTCEITHAPKLHKLTHIESSSSSLKIKKSKGIKRNLINNYTSEQSQIFIQ